MGSPNRSQLAGAERQSFAKGTWGGTCHSDVRPQPDDVVVREHWDPSGFANTDLDLPLEQFGTSHVIIIGTIANTRIEATGRFAAELSYHVTLAKDATTAFGPEVMDAAHAIDGPIFAHAILTIDELIAQLSA